MKAILYPAGGLGKTLEYGIKHFSRERGPLVGNPLTTYGSMHNYSLEKHIVWIDQVNEEMRDENKIVTIISPCQKQDYETSITKIKRFLNDKDQIIFISFNTVRAVEILWLMKYTKLPLTSEMSPIPPECYRQWDPNANSALDLKFWQLRELLSIQFNGQIDTYVNLDRYADGHWLIVDFEKTFSELPNIINQCISYFNWERNLEDINPFFETWSSKQKDITDRLIEIDNIVSNTLGSEKFTWNNLPLIDQVLIQARLLREGYELACDGLNNFPTSSIDLKKLLIKT